MSLLTVDDFEATQDPRLLELASFRPRATARTCHLILQAAFREGMLEGCDFTDSGDVLTWQRGAERLKVKGQVAGGGDRLRLDYEAWEFTLPDFLSLLSRLAPDIAPDALMKLRKEAEESELTQAVAYAVASHREVPKSYLDFEAWTPEGHNLHPGAKTRQGFTASEQLAYAPELCRELSLEWVKVKNSLLQHSGVVGQAFRAPDGDWLLPIHPWQKQRVLPRLYGTEIEDGQITDYDREPLRCRVCTSFRTVVPLDQGFPILKLSVGSLMTSTERSMSRFTVLQGPLYSRYFQRLQGQAPDLFQNVIPAPETGGLCWAQEQPEARSRNLSMLFRERCEMGGKERWVPSSALPQPHPQGGTVMASLFGRGPTLRRRFRDYLLLLIPFHLRLYQEFGLALEAHMQNCVVRWGESGPDKLWVRDWGGVRANGEILAETDPDLLSRLDSNSVTLSTADAAEKKLIACLYCNHLTEVVATLSWEGGESEDWLWNQVKDVTAAYARGSLARRILQERWPVKCLLKMRLGLGGDGDVYRRRDNPLQAAGR